MGFTVFDTAIGVCGLAWREDVVVGTSLPEGSAERTRAWLLRRFPDAVEGTPPAGVQEAMAGIVALLGGERRDLASVPLDFSGVPAFNRRAYEIARAIPPGKTLTYGDIAHRLGQPGSAQAVGQAMGHNPFPIIVPCHRVLAAGGKDGGFSARGGVGTKRRILVIEGALADEPTLF
ncbi:methylated-DNA-[protein]-cysteine S-methyltransferase [Amycolatopsis mediterranei S699]|uniref:methylated-DNA--[protein]-cysteine S-methyltransferase n=2 Tax=Amycolatopsis mediterranei TaxID=33910 RepID=A0A0H3CXG5_AMYMU|nr:methylated-DNA-[protein]-cysteine S-methyltransferase [Amycolatopsis mediterranei U32]AEK39723.1 methylated-DNA-[protein]-cysteine S-methyltransferase [Amycolatopsis mediterranei S699]AFO74742.1 methylated-DNA-[protein]-cysteine S-methyltransferase [Amycolatopsis mediterranei S699]AGT81871.1 methylated-DNA-[protein]-cysteine S-methyltransferase [Amycolatopsis mediterranei RB]